MINCNNPQNSGNVFEILLGCLASNVCTIKGRRAHSCYSTDLCLFISYARGYCIWVEILSLSFSVFMFHMKFFKTTCYMCIVLWKTFRNDILVDTLQRLKFSIEMNHNLSAIITLKILYPYLFRYKNCYTLLRPPSRPLDHNGYELCWFCF